MLFAPGQRAPNCATVAEHLDLKKGRCDGRNSRHIHSDRSDGQYHKVQKGWQTIYAREKPARAWATERSLHWTRPRWRSIECSSNALEKSQTPARRLVFQHELVQAQPEVGLCKDSAVPFQIIDNWQVPVVPVLRFLMALVVLRPLLALRPLSPLCTIPRSAITRPLIFGPPPDFHVYEKRAAPQTQPLCVVFGFGLMDSPRESVRSSFIIRVAQLRYCLAGFKCLFHSLHLIIPRPVVLSPVSCPDAADASMASPGGSDEAARSLLNDWSSFSRET